jgi:predicted DNA-binding transcriptional regulator YafY
VLRVLNASLALVSEQQWPQLEAALTARGITLTDGLAVQAQTEKVSAAQKAAASLGVSTGRQLAEAQPATNGKARGQALQRLSGRQLADFIESAIDNERTLTIEYQKPNEPRASIRTVDPHQLEVRGGGYYLHGFCHTRQEERVFRLANVLGVAISDE